MGSSGLAQERLKFTSSIKESPVFYLPITAAESQGFWKQNGLDVEWIPFRGAGELYRAVAARAVLTGLQAAAGQIQATARGVPVIIISELQSAELFSVWLRADSPVRDTKGLKGVRLGVPQLGGTSHAYGLLIAKDEGFPQGIKFIAVGGLREIMAAMKTGSLDGTIQPPHLMMELKVKGEIKEVVSVARYVPREWLGHIVFAHRDMIKDQPELVGRVMKGVLMATNFLKSNSRWAIEKMKAQSGFSESAAKMIYDTFAFTSDGKISRKGVENLFNFLVDYGILRKERAPALDEFYTTRFTG